MILQGCGPLPVKQRFKEYKKIAFFDRDGVINKDLGYVHKKHQFIFMEGIEEFFKRVLARRYLIVVVTNQSGIGRGYYTKKQFFELTNWHNNIFKKKDIEIAMTLFCPHSPAENNIDNCPFRKPNPMMVRFALNYFNADPNKSFLIGDKLSDIEAANSAGVKRTYLFKNLEKASNGLEGLKYINKFEEIDLNE